MENVNTFASTSKTSGFLFILYIGVLNTFFTCSKVIDVSFSIHIGNVNTFARASKTLGVFFIFQIWIFKYFFTYSKVFDFSFYICLGNLNIFACATKTLAFYFILYKCILNTFRCQNLNDLMQRNFSIDLPKLLKMDFHC